METTSSGLAPFEFETQSSAQNETVCLYQGNNPFRTAAMVMSGVAILENGLLLIAMAIYWPKFLSNLYRFVASLLCADLLIGVFVVCVHILKFYDSTSETIAFFKGIYGTMHMVSTFSVSLVNASVFFTYSRFTTRLLEQHAQNADDTRASRVRHYFRKPSVAYVLIASVWALGVISVILSVVTRCRAATHGCTESCSTVVSRAPNTEEASACLSVHCNKFLAPLSSYYTLFVVIMFWISFAFLIGSTMTVVCVKVNVRVADGSTYNNGFNEDDEKTSPRTDAPDSEESEKRDDNIFSAEKPLPSVEESGKEESGKMSPVHYSISREFGFNRDLMSRFSLLITITQCIFWMPVTAIILYTLVANRTFSTFRNFEIIQIYFALPTILNPWICVLTMSKLRDALFHVYYSICH